MMSMLNFKSSPSMKNLVAPIVLMLTLIYPQVINLLLIMTIIFILNLVIMFSMRGVIFLTMKTFILMRLLLQT